jgi:hypothetical protein
MANYYATTRSNYFRVKDAKAFEQWCNDFPLRFWTKQLPEHPGDTFYAISAPEGCMGWPSSQPYNAATDEYVDTEVELDLPEHLDPRDVAVLLEVGSEEHAALVGTATAVHPDGTIIYLSLRDIYHLARHKFGDALTITEATC